MSNTNSTTTSVIVTHDGYTAAYPNWVAAFEDTDFDVRSRRISQNDEGYYVIEVETARTGERQVWFADQGCTTPEQVAELALNHRGDNTSADLVPISYDKLAGKPSEYLWDVVSGAVDAYQGTPDPSRLDMNAYWGESGDATFIHESGYALGFGAVAGWHGKPGVVVVIEDLAANHRHVRAYPSVLFACQKLGLNGERITPRMLLESESYTVEYVESDFNPTQAGGCIVAMDRRGEQHVFRSMDECIASLGDWIEDGYDYREIELPYEWLVRQESPFRVNKEGWV